MGDKGQRRFYVGGRWYSLDNATPLCRCTDIFERVTLYQTPKGAFSRSGKAPLMGWGLTARRWRCWARPPPARSWTNTPPGLSRKTMIGLSGSRKRDRRERAGRR